MALTSKEWRVYNLLKSQPDHWFSCEEIKKEVPDVVVIDDERNPSPELTQMRIKLNDSPEIDKIITTKAHKFKIATFEEYKQERSSHIARIKSQVAQVKAQDKKFEQDGQGKLFNNILDELKPENEQFHETFVDKPIVVEKEFEDPKAIAFVDLYHKTVHFVEKVDSYKYYKAEKLVMVTNCFGYLIDLHCISEIYSFNEFREHKEYFDNSWNWEKHKL